MNPSLRRLFASCFITCCIFITKSAIAQTVKNDDSVIIKWASQPVTVDGQFTDWTDSLRYFNDDTQFSFDFQNDHKNLYLAIKSKDKQNLNRILARGISFSVNTGGKKKQGSTVIFPVLERSTQPAKSAKGKPDLKEIQANIQSRIKRIVVTGFDDILDGSISMDNTYGVAAAAGFDSDDNLVLEIAVPFHQLGISTSHDILAMLIEINGIKQPRSAYNPNRDSRGGMYGYPRRDYRYDRMPVVNKQNAATGFWIKATLAKR